MAIVYKIDIAAALKDKGITQYQLQQAIKNKDSDKAIMGVRSYRGITKEGKLPSMNELDALCRVLGLQVGEILEYVPDELTTSPPTTP